MTLKPEGYRTRLIEKEIRSSLRAFGGVCIEGPKWCGKTWVGLSMSNSAYMIGDTDEYGQSMKDLADMNVRNAMSGDPPHLIDEWQDVPKVWDAVRSDIDRRSARGLYILTGSSAPKTVRPVHSGTGRISRVRMRTMSLYESGDSSGTVSLDDIMHSRDIGVHSEAVTLEKLVELTIAGGWPGNAGLPFGDRAESVRGYLNSVIRDASRLDGVSRKESNLMLVMRSLARNECTLASVSKIHNDTGIPLGDGIPLILSDRMEAERPPISYDTVYDYLDVFGRLYLTSDQPAFDPNVRSSVRVGKTAKRHLTDPSLAAAALGVGKDRLIKDLRTFGFLFESLCERDLCIYSAHMGAGLYHYHDSDGTEADAVIEMPDGTWGAFEIKLGANQIDSAASSLIRLRDKMVRNGGSVPSVLCVICGLTDRSYRRDDGVYVVPIMSLGP